MPTIQKQRMERPQDVAVAGIRLLGCLDTYHVRFTQTWHDGLAWCNRRHHKHTEGHFFLCIFDPKDLISVCRYAYNVFLTEPTFMTARSIVALIRRDRYESINGVHRTLIVADSSCSLMGITTHKSYYSCLIFLGVIPIVPFTLAQTALLSYIWVPRATTLKITQQWFQVT